MLVFTGMAMGCASARMSDHESDRLFKEGRYDDAAERLKKGLAKQGDDSHDELLYLFDIGLSLHSSGKFEESNQVFLKADKISEVKEYVSLAKEAETLLASENTKDYKGEDFEKVLISTYLAMNYSLMGDWENALVEARRVNQKLYMMVNQGQRKYKQNAFARYLSAVLYEADQDYNDAYVDYKNTLDLMPNFPGLGGDLWRCAMLLNMPDEMERWDTQFKLTDADHQKAKLTAPKSKKGEIIVLYENGISPEKRPNPHFNSIPKFYARHNPVHTAIVEVNGENKGNTVVLDNIEATAIANLDEKYSGIIAKKVAGVVAKEAVAYGVAKATGSRFFGALTEGLLYAADKADVRSWNLLPRDLQVLRIPVEAGTYKVKVLPQGAQPLGEKLIQVGAGKKVFVNFRYTP